MQLRSVFLCLLLLCSCTSAPVNIHYYLLHTPESHPISINDASKPTAALQPLSIADYLQQSSLVMQVNQNQLHYARQDLWAETLQSSFYKALLQDLNTYGQRNYMPYTPPYSAQTEVTISVQLDHFHVTDTSSVISSGRYTLSNPSSKDGNNRNTARSSHAFYFESELTQDGYAHAVEQLRSLVVLLSKQIEEDIAALPD
ncbi:ABC-type transport auxiliary lipoprotein family protein [uncultured Paraglaciecola sp.]|uniref:PqiC family protein n=1 Tax=uncultured Paraglaciecola sp. TaxID=1765024 RepID=UPI00262C6961|nr:ABC-type transport auxiliary lipoprotein family protein [uncultured Paraglaciecola sp.]